MTAPPRDRRLAAALLALACLCGTGCHNDMRDQPRLDSLQASEFFPDGMAARPLVEGTIPFRGVYHEDEAFDTGRENGEFVAMPPVEVTAELLSRGQSRYNIFCLPCHAPTGDGNGMIVQRGFRRPPSFHIDRLRNAPAGHYFDVVTHGFGAMPSYRVQIPKEDRWAIVVYVRALQRSQNATLDDVPPEIGAQLIEEAGP
jgi:mono/diheme cytochrome c family protein